MNGASRFNTLSKKLWRGQPVYAGFPQRLIATDSQGWNSNHAYLTDLIESRRPNVVLEVGVWKGGSVITMARKMQELVLDSVVIAVDTWLGSFENWSHDDWFLDLSFEHGYPRLFHKFLANVLDAGLQDYVIPLPLDSLNAFHVLRMQGIQLDAIHIDGCHDYSSVSSDLRNWWGLLNDGGLLIVDDYYEQTGIDNVPWPEVRCATDDFLATVRHSEFQFHSGKCRAVKLVDSDCEPDAAPLDRVRSVSHEQSSAPTRIVDAFTFFNEVDTLELRLRELAPIADIFVLVESAEAFSGVRKPFIFDQVKSRFARYLDRIVHIKLPGLPPLTQDTETGRFRLEQFQRNAIMLGLLELGLTTDDIVLISDADEIPSRTAVAAMANAICRGDVWVFKQRLYKEYLDALMPPEPRRWLGTVAVKYGAFGDVLPDQLRRNAQAGRFYEPSPELSRTEGTQVLHFIEEAGWHLTYFGGRKSVRYKTANFSHGARSDPGAASIVPPVSAVRDSYTDLLRPFDSRLRVELEQSIQDLGRDLPGAVAADLARYYHLFHRSFAPASHETPTGGSRDMTNV